MKVQIDVEVTRISRCERTKEFIRISAQPAGTDRDGYDTEMSFVVPREAMVGVILPGDKITIDLNLA